jgi:hypothetical protein
MAKQSATHQGPGAESVSRNLCVQTTVVTEEACAGARAAEGKTSAGTTRHKTKAMIQDNTANKSHQVRHPSSGNQMGPANKVSAVPAGM